MKSDPFLHELYDSLGDTPMQRKFRKMAPMPLGCVFIAWNSITEDEVRSHLRTMKELGYTALKGVCGSDTFSRVDIQHIAVEEGISPWWYDQGGWQEITPELLKELGLPEDMDIDDAMADPKMIERQKKLMHERIDRSAERERVSTCAGGTDEFKDKKKPEWLVPSVVGQHRGHLLTDQNLDDFIEWLKDTYGDVPALLKAWNIRAVSLADGKPTHESWDDIRAMLVDGGNSKEYRHLRDIMRFNADRMLEQRIGRACELRRAFDENEPIRGGGEAGLFLPFAARGVDMEAVARRLADDGSFYPSMHLAWHYEEVDFEVARPVYMQASIAADWAKGIWSATWESTGGPQYFSGGKAPFVPEVRQKFPGFTVDAGTMTQLMLSYLAAGFKGFGLWCWNARPVGWEGGEFALTDRNRKPVERTRAVGAIGKAAVRYRRELWEGHKEPVVGIMVDWDNEAFWGAMAITGRDMYRSVPINARIGASRAFIDANVPWEYVTTGNLRAGLGPRYKAVYLPAFISISTELHEMLLAYADQGGRVVMDMPGAYYDEFGRIYRTDEGTLFERTFGCVLHEFAFANPRHTPDSIAGVDCGGFLAELSLTSGEAVVPYDASGKPAIVENGVGKGSAVLIGTQASYDCVRPGNAATQDLIVRHTLGKGIEPPFTCDGCIAYRMASPAADHYFLVNDGPETPVKLDTKSFSYKDACDAVTGEALDLASEIAMPQRSGRWIRCSK